MLDLEVLLELAHGAPDETAALEALCQFVCERLRAATVQVVTGPQEPRTFARVGRPWQGDPHTCDQGRGVRGERRRRPARARPASLARLPNPSVSARK